MNTIRFAKSLAAGAALMVASSSANALDLMFDGFCDGLSITTDANGFTTGNRTGCDSFGSFVVGTKGRVDSKPKKKPAYTLRASRSTPVPDTFQRVIFQINLDKTYVFYNTDGSQFATGTWSEVTPEAAAEMRFGGGKSSTQ